MNAEALISRLDGVKKTGASTWLARCPAHADRSPSLSIRGCDDGRILVHCFAQCDINDVVAALGITIADLMPPSAIGNHIKPERRPFNAHDVLLALETELSIATLATLDIGKGKLSTETERERLLLASRRIRSAIDLVTQSA